MARPPLTSKRTRRPAALRKLPRLRKRAVVPVYRDRLLQRVREMAASYELTPTVFCEAMSINSWLLYGSTEIVRTSLGESLARLLGDDILVPVDLSIAYCAHCQAQERAAPKPLVAEPVPSTLTLFEQMVHERRQEQERRTTDREAARKQELKDMSRQADLELDRRRKEHKQLKEHRL